MVVALVLFVPIVLLAVWVLWRVVPILARVAWRIVVGTLRIVRTIVRAIITRKGHK